ncbi:uracil-DNA glycosylase family protein [Castellaniella sp.]|uniref:uracil-DNA glycosylase n=1 Tax=Castellaniella sp. TaxID=1955812 RepID=UPI003566C251
MKPAVNALQQVWLKELGVDLQALPGVTPQVAPRVSSARGPVAAPPVGPGAAPSGQVAPRPAAPGSAAAKSDAPARPASVGVADTAANAPAVPDLQALSTAVQACERCVRATGRIRAVPGSGVHTRPWYLLVGEQPGLEDEAAGLPFQGQAGQLLEAMLASVSLPHRDSRYSTYAVKCRAVGGSQPDDAERAACRPWLQQQIEILRPRWILALGRVATQAILGTADRFESLRGRTVFYVLESGERIPVRVTHLPSSLLVHGALKDEAWRDLLGLAEAVRAQDGAETQPGGIAP